LISNASTSSDRCRSANQSVARTAANAPTPETQPPNAESAGRNRAANWSESPDPAPNAAPRANANAAIAIAPNAAQAGQNMAYRTPFVWVANRGPPSRHA